jgi:hypothetical protein
MQHLFSRFFICSSILLTMALTTVAQSSTDRPRNEIEVRGLVSVPSGEANFSGTTASGSTIDLGRDFEFNNKLGYNVRFSHKSENDKHKFVVQYGRENWDQTATLTRSFTFRGETYVKNATAAADLTLRTFRGMYSYRWGNDKIRVGPMVDMGVVSTSLKLTGTTNNGTRTGEGSITKFAATVGYDLDYDPDPRVNIFNNVGAIAFQGERLFHAEGGLKYFASHHFGVLGGYKYERYRTTENSNFLLVQSHGPFFGGVFRF